MEQVVNGYLKRLLRVPLSFTSIVLCGKSSKLLLPLSSLVEEFKVARCRLVMTFRNETDTRVNMACVQVRTERERVVGFNSTKLIRRRACLT